MSFYQQISQFSDYLHSIRKLEEYLSFDIMFPVKWGIPKSIVDEGQLIPFSTGDENTKGFSFVSSINEKEINELINKVLKIIKINKDREIKDKLFKETIEKLKNTFEKNDLEKLKKLYFDFESDMQTPLENEQNGEISENIELA
jgi:hypothetical protein